MTDLGQVLEDLRALRVVVRGIAPGNDCAVTQDRRRKAIAAIDSIERKIAAQVRPRGRLASFWTAILGGVDDIGSAHEGPASEPDALQLLRAMRGRGWMVGVHNDYRQNREFHTFWLFTDDANRSVKGEGRSDEEALRAALHEADRLDALASTPRTHPTELDRRLDAAIRDTPMD